MNNKENKIIIISFIVFAFSLAIFNFLKINAFIYLSGFFLALFIPGFSIVNMIGNEKHWLEKIIISPVFTIFFFIPIYYIVTLLLHSKINLVTAFSVILAIGLLSIFIKKKKELTPEKKPGLSDLKFLSFGVITFLLLHLITTMVYRFIPEIDGYSYLMNVEETLSSGIFHTSYRPLFMLLADYVAIVSKIPPYWLFKFSLIIAQISGVYYLYQIIKKADIENSFAKYSLLLLFISVPVINLEIDYIRPNAFFILALLPFIYYLSKGLDGFEKNFIISSIIATSGLLFHEFFGILFIINLFFITGYFYKRLDFYKKTLMLGGFFVSLFLIILNAEKIPVFIFILGYIDNFLKLIMEGIDWKWWFLGTYTNVDGFNLGWTGLGILKSYAYFLSPILAIALPVVLFCVYKKIKKNKLSSTEKIGFLIFLVGFIFAEILPRIDYKTLPDRFWPMITISLISLVPFIFSEIKIINKKIFFMFAIFLSLIGIGGTIYIAKAKAGYVSKREHKAAGWIKENTSKNSLFITQGGNSAMINYFANRQNTITPGAYFFQAEQKIATEKNSEKILKNINNIFNNSLKNPSEENLAALNSSLKAYHKEIKKEDLIKKVDQFDFVLSKNDTTDAIYVVYSFDKFNNYYATRQWWLDVNFHGADLSKFKNDYDLIYNDDDIIYIWKKK